MTADALPTPESPSPEGGTPEAVVSALAPIRRTLEWALLDPHRFGSAPFLGRSSAQRVRRVAAQLDVATLEPLAVALDAVDAADPEGRASCAEAALAEAARWVSRVETGPYAVRAIPLGALVDPRRRRRRGDKTRSAEASAEAPADAAAAADTPQGDAAAASPDGAAPDLSAAAAAAGEASATVEEAPKRSKKRSGREGRADTSAPREEEPPAARRWPFGHPEGTGAALSTVDGAPTDLVAALEAHGILTIADLLLRAPSELRRAPRVRFPHESEDPVMVRGRVLWRRVLLGAETRRLEVALLLRGGQTVTARWVLGEPRGWAEWLAGTDVALVGELVDDEEGARLYDPEPVGLAGRGSGLLAEYGLDGVEDRSLRDLLARCVSAHLGRIEDWMPNAIREQERLLPLDEALRDAHFPANSEAKGRARLAFEELLLLQLGIGWRTAKRTSQRGLSHRAVHTGVGRLDAQHGVQLSDSQEQAFSEIRRDLVRQRCMNRLLQGDVGAGKGLVSLVSAIMVAENGSQVAFICPDALTAERRFLHAESILRSLAIVPLLVTDAPDRGSADAIGRGEAHVVFGTTELVREGVKWKRLGLVVSEERAPYGALTRDSLAHLPHQPDLLVFTRAPIPASLVFSVFGGFEISMVGSEDPLLVSSQMYGAEERAEAYRHAREAVESGRQAFVVFPVREGRDLLGRKDAMRMAKALQGDAFPGARIGVYSSEMTRDERSRVFDDFQHRRVDVLVCTTYIEDAPGVANAGVMVVEYADLHDLVRLHRLRGHVGQGWRPGACHFILSDDPTKEDADRVRIVVKEQDGFRLAEHDLELRGREALLGDRADEMPQTRWARPTKDRPLLLRARTAAFRQLRQDPGLRRTRALARAVGHRWGDWLDLVFPIAQGAEPLPAAEPRQRRRRRRRRKR